MAPEYCLPKRWVKTKVRIREAILKEGFEMKRLLVLILVWTLLVLTGTLVSADGHTRVKQNDNIKSEFVITLLRITEETDVIR